MLGISAVVGFGLFFIFNTFVATVDPLCVTALGLIRNPEFIPTYDEFSKRLLVGGEVTFSNRIIDSIPSYFPTRDIEPSVEHIDVDNLQKDLSSRLRTVSKYYNVKQIRELVRFVSSVIKPKKLTLFFGLHNIELERNKKKYRSHSSNHLVGFLALTSEGEEVYFGLEDGAIEINMAPIHPFEVRTYWAPLFERALSSGFIGTDFAEISGGGGQLNFGFEEDENLFVIFPRFFANFLHFWLRDHASEYLFGDRDQMGPLQMEPRFISLFTMNASPKTQGSALNIVNGLLGGLKDFDKESETKIQKKSLGFRSSFQRFFKRQMKSFQFFQGHNRDISLYDFTIGRNPRIQVRNIRAFNSIEEFETATEYFSKVLHRTFLNRDRDDALGPIESLELTSDYPPQILRESAADVVSELSLERFKFESFLRENITQEIDIDGSEIVKAHPALLNPLRPFYIWISIPHEGRLKDIDRVLWNGHGSRPYISPSRFFFKLEYRRDRKSNVLVSWYSSKEDLVMKTILEITPDGENLPHIRIVDQLDPKHFLETIFSESIPRQKIFSLFLESQFKDFGLDKKFLEPYADQNAKPYEEKIKISIPNVLGFQKSRQHLEKSDFESATHLLIGLQNKKKKNHRRLKILKIEYQGNYWLVETEPLPAGSQVFWEIDYSNYSGIALETPKGVTQSIHHPIVTARNDRF